MVAPTAKPIATINTPNHLPKTKPAKRAIGDPKPPAKTQTIVNSKI